MDELAIIAWGGLFLALFFMLVGWVWIILGDDDDESKGAN